VRATGAQLTIRRMPQELAGTTDPRAVYTSRLAEHEASRDRWRLLADRLSKLRLAVFATGVAMCWPVFASETVAPVVLAIPAVAFAALVLAHDRVIARGQRAGRVVAFYERGLARVEDRWAAGGETHGETGERYRDPAHPYTDDLDLFGRGSLFALLNGARTRGGEDRLAGWLCAPADPSTLRARQAEVAELRPRLDLRQDFAVLGDEVAAGLHPEALRSWGEAPAVLGGAAVRYAAAGFALVTLVSLALWLVAGLGSAPFQVALAAQGSFALRYRARVRRVVASVEARGRDLDLFAQLLARLERESFASPGLVRLRSALDTRGVPPSRRIASLRRLIELLDARRNQLFAPLAALLLWQTQLATAIEHWRAVCGSSVAHWTDAVAELEALGSLAAFAYEHPRHPFPEISEDATRFDGRAVGHPLLPDATCVRNDVALGSETRVLVISGSNMSGKSTLLRTVGTNAVLAFAGAPVCAASLRISPLSIGASLRVRDSLLEGRSRFYAEIERLRQIVELCDGQLPVLFLLDEILHGTNSHDRGIGAEAVVRGLVERGALGLVTTHDLALARVAEVLAPRGRNVHFEDHLEEGEIMFDYRVRPGVVERSNALALMRAVGLDV
jgi:hypothetical protein